MSYSLDEDIERAQKRLEFLKAVQKKYPDVEQVTVGGRSIYTSAAATDDCTEVMVFETKDRSVLLPYVEFAEGRVYGSSFEWALVWSVLDTLKKEDPDAYKSIVRIASKG